MSWWTTERKRYAGQYLIHGAALTAIGSAGLVSRWANVEASGGPASVNPYSGAFGIAQWLGSRLPPIKGNTNFDAQLAYAVRELNGSETRAGNVLRNARTVTEAARGASMYERAEGYNAATGTDNWTAKTASGIPSIAALLSATAVPENVAQNQSNGSYQDSAIEVPGNTNTKLLTGIAAGAALLWLLRS